MFELEISPSKSEPSFVSDRVNMFKKVLESLSDIVEQIEIKVSAGGLNIQVMDSMHVALADVFFSTELFSKFRCDRDLQLGVPLKSFLQILKNINISDKSVFNLSCGDNPETIHISHNDDMTKLDTDLLLFQIGCENYDLPDIEYNSIIEMATADFRCITKTVGMFGEYISFNVQKDEAIISQDGDMVKSKILVKSNDQTTSINSTSPVKLEIAMKYINLVNKVSNVSDLIVISMHQEAPIFFNLKLFNMGYIRFYVAPKMG